MERLSFAVLASCTGLMLGGVPAYPQQIIFHQAVNQPIPDNYASGVSSSITLSGLNFPGIVQVAGVNVLVNLHHDFSGDLLMQVTAPDAATYALVDRPGWPAFVYGNPDGYVGSYIFDNSAAAPIPEFAVGGLLPIPPGAYRPEVALPTGFSIQAGEVWTLHVADLDDDLVGTLYFWELILLLQQLEQAVVAPTIAAVSTSVFDPLFGTLEDRKYAALAANPEDGLGLWLRSGGQIGGLSAGISGAFLPTMAEVHRRSGFVQFGATGEMFAGVDGRGLGTLFGLYATGDASVDGGANGSGSVATTGGGAGAAFTWLGSSGFYADVLALASIVAVDSRAGPASGSTSGVLAGGSIEIGQGLAFDDFTLTPQGQLTYRHLSLADFTDDEGTTVSITGAQSLEARLGLVLERDTALDDAGTVLRTNAGLHLRHGFGAGATTAVNDTPLGFAPQGTELMASGGFNVIGVGQLTLGLQGNYRHTVAGGNGGTFGASATVRARF